MSEKGRHLMARIADFRGVSREYMLGEYVCDVHRETVCKTAEEVELLDRQLPDWRERLARAEMIGSLVLARAAGLSWPEVCRLSRTAVSEVRNVEVDRGLG